MPVIIQNVPPDVILTPKVVQPAAIQRLTIAATIFAVLGKLQRVVRKIVLLRPQFPQPAAIVFVRNVLREHFVLFQMSHLFRVRKIVARQKSPSVLTAKIMTMMGLLITLQIRVVMIGLIRTNIIRRQVAYAAMGCATVAKHKQAVRQIVRAAIAVMDIVKHRKHTHHVPKIAVHQLPVILIKYVNMARVRDRAHRIVPLAQPVPRLLQMAIPLATVVHGVHVQTDAIMIPKDVRAPVWRLATNVRI